MRAGGKGRGAQRGEQLDLESLYRKATLQSEPDPGMHWKGGGGAAAFSLPPVAPDGVCNGQYLAPNRLTTPSPTALPTPGVSCLGLVASRGVRCALCSADGPGRIVQMAVSVST